MAAGILVSVEEYLNTTYRPDRDYIDGEVVERNLGKRKHGRAQGNTYAWMRAREAKLRIVPVVEVRLKVAERRYRIPDVMVLSADAPEEDVVATAPLLCVEVLSPCDTLTEIWGRSQDYFAIGVPTCWIIDPENAIAWIATPTGLVEAKDGILRAGEIEMPLAEVLE